jgi:D-sedoheptulose 7-phosphate isomerase
MMGRFKDHRRSGWPAVSLTTDTSVLTAIANDYGYEHVFERQVQVLCGPADVLVCMSTSGTSKNVLLAAEAARRNESTVLAFTGHDGSALAALAHTTLIVPSTDTARIQEAHIFIGHVLCGLLEEELAQ